jgi:hypothetical protein
MATLAADTPRVFETGHDEYINELDCIAADIVFEGAAVGELNDTGTYQPLATSSTVDKFAGFCYEQCDNSTGVAAAKKIKVKQLGRIKLSVVGVAAKTDVGKTVWATDDNTFTLTYAAGAVSIGTVERHVAGTECVVSFRAFNLRAPIQVSGTWLATSVDGEFFVAPRPYMVTFASARVTAAGTDAAAATAAIKKAPSGTAIASGTALHTSTINLKGTANTNQSLTLSATPADRKIAQGDAIGFDFTGTLTTATGTATVELIPL